MSWPLERQQLSLVEFAKALLETRDLDPVYFGLQGIKDKAQLKRWLVAYWCFYHCGFACYASEREGGDFWYLLIKAAENTVACPAGGRWPRSAERRHFRGKAALSCVTKLQAVYTLPEAFVAHIAKGQTLAEVTKRVTEHYLFGPWIAFKCADMLERCLRIPVKFAEDALLYDAPMAGGLLAWQESALRDRVGISPAEKVQVMAEGLQYQLKKYKAPPFYDRPIGLQELETCFCKWGSHRSGHYPIGKDIREIRHGLQGWLGISDAARKFEHALPPLV